MMRVKLSQRFYLSLVNGMIVLPRVNYLPRAWHFDCSSRRNFNKQNIRALAECATVQRDVPLELHVFCEETSVHVCWWRSMDVVLHLKQKTLPRPGHGRWWGVWRLTVRTKMVCRLRWCRAEMTAGYLLIWQLTTIWWKRKGGRLKSLKAELSLGFMSKAHPNLDQKSCCPHTGNPST